ncbi:MAG: PAS domain-containing protein [archaeon]
MAKEKEKEETYLDLSNVLFVSLDTKGRVTEINKPGLKMLGWDEKNVLGKDWFVHFVPRKARADLKREFKRTIKMDPRGTVRFLNDQESPVKGKSGEVLLKWSTTVMRDKDGHVKGLLCSGEDITEKERAESLAEAYKDFVENSTVLMVRLQPDGNVETVNKTFLKAVGYSEPEIVNFKISKVLYPSERQAFKKMLGQLFTTKKISHIETRLVSKNGSIIHLSGAATCKYKAKKPVHVIALFKVTSVERAKRKAVKKASGVRRRASVKKKRKKGAQGHRGAGAQKRKAVKKKQVKKKTKKQKTSAKKKRKKR